MVTLWECHHQPQPLHSRNWLWVSQEVCQSDIGIVGQGVSMLPHPTQRLCLSVASQIVFAEPVGFSGYETEPISLLSNEPLTEHLMVVMQLPNKLSPTDLGRCLTDRQTDRQTQFSFPREELTKAMGLYFPL